MKYFNLLYLLVTVLFTFSSCKEEDDPKPLTNTEILTAKSWKVSKIYSVSEENNMNIFFDITNARFAEILKNSGFTFHLVGTYTQKSSGSGANGFWEFSNDETSIILDQGTNAEEIWDIKELKDNSLKIKTMYVFKDELGNHFSSGKIEIHLKYEQ